MKEYKFVSILTSSFSSAYQWCESWWTPASLEQTCALANCHVQLLVASIGGVRTRFGCEPGKARGKLSSIAMGLRVSDGVKKKMVRVAYALRSSSAFIRSRNGRYMSW